MVGLKELAAGLSLSRRVTLSAIVFAFAGAFLYAKFPAVFGPIAEKYYFIGGCFLLGGALQSSVESVIRYLTPKATKEVSYYDDLQELHRDFQRGLIPPETYERIADRLIERRFLGDDTKQLPR